MLRKNLGGDSFVMRVKICGIKRIEDAMMAVELGTDAIGLLVGQTHASNDFIDEKMAKEIVERIPPFCSSVLVTHITDIEEVIRMVKYIGVTTIQLHGDCTTNDILSIRKAMNSIKIIKSLHVINQGSIEKGKEYLALSDAILLDTVNFETNQIGGTGKTHDWNISKNLVENYKIPVILAGGLNPENVESAISKVRPFGVDVNSGVKGINGFKDYNKLKMFIKRAKNAAEYGN